MRRKVVKISLLVVSLLISFVLPIVAVTAKKKEWVIDPVYIDDTIEDNTWADLAAKNHPWLKGKGTEEDPYMIKNVVIDAEGLYFCMLIMNSEAYFKIMDCTFSNTGPYGSPDERNAAIILVSTQNGVIFKNEMYDCGFSGTGLGGGIALIASSNNKVQKNFCHDNELSGIYVQYSSDNVIRQNLCTGNTYGIFLMDWSNNNEITKNECYDNKDHGILLYSGSNGNLLTKNKCKRNLSGGITISEAHGNVLIDNQCDDNTIGIILANGATYNEVTNNDCYNNMYTGIYMTNNANENSITENECSGNGNGIVIEYAHGNDVIDNVCSENIFEQGILIMTYASDNTITGNRCFKNQRSGIVLYNMASNNIIADNICYENLESGIVIDSSFLNTVENNLVYGNAYTGMQVYNNAENNRVAWNTFTENYIGIQLLYSNGNEISNNVCNESLASGISVESSNGNFISENHCSENFGSGIAVVSGYGNIITDNNCRENVRGIHLKYSSDNLIKQNLCTGNTWGIVINTWSSYNEVINNDCLENGDGIAIANGASDNKITDNTCTDNYENGIILWNDANYNVIDQNNCSENLLSGIWVAMSNGNILTFNNCSNNGENGIFLVDWWDPMHLRNGTANNILYGNHIASNLNGIHLLEADKNDIFRNTIEWNDVGIFMEDQSAHNIIYQNNFIDNEVQASNEHAGLNNWHSIYILEGNYWSDYTGTDSDGDGVGDTPWPWPDFDVYPFMEENGWEITTPLEDELLNAWFYPDFNRLGASRTVHNNKTTYLMVGMGHLFSERIQDIYRPPYTCRLWFYGTEFYFEGTISFFRDDSLYGEPIWYHLFFLRIPPYTLLEAGLPPGWNEFQWELTFYSGGEQQTLYATSYFFLI